jgi:uncharacterized coiled-coil protein SlyX
MKTIEQFIKDNEGQPLEVAGSANAKNQCVDCVNGYIRDVLGFPIIEWTNAIDFKNKANGNYEIIYNDLNNPNLVPEVGDIVVYESPDGIGHICFCIRKGTVLTFGAFEQNWPVGSPCKSTPNKKYVIGNYVVVYWMRPKGSIIEDMTDEEKRILEFLNGKSEGDVREAFGALQDIPKLNKEINDLKSSQKDLEARIEQLEADATANNKLIEDYQSTITTAKDTESNLKADIQTWKNRYEAKCKETIDKYSALELLKLGILKLLGKK